MVITTNFFVAAIVALFMTLLLSQLLPRVAAVLATQIILSAVGVYFGLTESTALSCAVIAVWLIIVVTVCIKGPRVQMQATRIHFRVFKR